MRDAAPLAPRQIWAFRPTATTTYAYQSGCSPFVLPSDGYIHLSPSRVLTLTENAIFEPICTGQPTQFSRVSSVLDTSDPFYSSVTPQLYATACATVVSYLLVIILFITPRTFYIGGPGGGASFLSRHGMISGSYSGNSSVVGVGGRPWLQKVAATLVAISLTIASVDSFRVAEQQYDYGYSDAGKLTSEVIGGLEIRVARVISSTFLWLAQVQTLIRLFPRHKEKVIIKWAGFAMIVLDTTFSILDRFYVPASGTKPRMYEDAIPALSYLFEFSLNLLYAACVVFYSLSKHRFAFFHPKMRNICLVALLSLCAIVIPIVFFVIDISKPDIAGWGIYIKWVGSAAASVVVWEWVERIEALERDENKDGILGKEIFDGDEMLEVTPSEEVDWSRRVSNHDRGGGGGVSSGWGGVISLANRPLRTRVGLSRGRRGRRSRGQHESDIVPVGSSNHGVVGQPLPPSAVNSPINRGDTTSADSTVYSVRYHNATSPTPPIALPHMEEDEEEEAEKLPVIFEATAKWNAGEFPAEQADQLPRTAHTGWRWRSALQFKRRRASLPKEIAFAQAEEGQASAREEPYLPDEGSDNQGARLGTDYVYRRNRTRGFRRERRDNMLLPVTVIPASRRGQEIWSPQWLDDSTRNSQRIQRHLPWGSSLPVMVIPSQRRVSTPWVGPNGETEFDSSDYEMRYDPDTAALVVPGNRHLINDTRIDPSDRRSCANAVGETDGTDQPPTSAEYEAMEPSHSSTRAPTEYYRSSQEDIVRRSPES